MRTLAILMGFLFAGTVAAADYAELSGKQLFQRYCAACHGTEARGDGPVASSLKVEVPDLTTMARRSAGHFPRDRVMRIIDGRFIIGAHGTRTMPIWGEDFAHLEIGSPNTEAATRLVIDHIADYLAQLQQKEQ